MSDTQTFLGQDLENYSESAAIVSKELWKKGSFKTQGLKMLAMFKCYGWIPTTALSKVFKQYNARIYDLRKGKVDGTCYMIKTEIRKGVWGFLYEGVY